MQGLRWTCWACVLASAAMKNLTHACALVAMLGLLMLTAGCAAIVGDECVHDSDCGTGLLCDSSLPGGYCTRPGCEASGCSAEGLCVIFNEEISYCMKPCESGEDCRSSYKCVTDFGPFPFCAVPSTDDELQ